MIKSTTDDRLTYPEDIRNQVNYRFYRFMPLLKRPGVFRENGQLVPKMFCSDFVCMCSPYKLMEVILLEVENNDEILRFQKTESL